jgi:hypothetical protein
MVGKKSNTAPMWFSVAGVLALFWNLMGVFAYLAQVRMTEADFAALPEAQRLLYETTPAWATGAFALAVFAGTLGCLLLILRKSLAAALLIISLLAVLVQMFHAFFMSKFFEVFGSDGMIMPVMVIAVAFFLVWMAEKGKKYNWLS